MAKKKSARRTHRAHRRASRVHTPGEHYLVAVRGWMLVVAFALMLGVGAVVGSYINTQLDLATPTVAGASTYR